jgi:hypothetical protein
MSQNPTTTVIVAALISAGRPRPKTKNDNTATTPAKTKPK